MTILKATNNLCKILQKSPIHEEVQRLFNALDDSGREMSLGSIASVLNRQFLGYLIANQEAHRQREQLDLHLRPDIHLLSPEELKTLEKAHKIILKINNSISSLDNLLPSAQSSISPYSDYDYSLINSDSTELSFEEANKALDELKTQFSQHSALTLLQDCVTRISGSENIKEGEFINNILYYRQQIIRHGFFEVPKNLEVDLFNRGDALQFYMGRLMRSLIVLRDSISNIDQFLYQAIRYNKPMILDRNNVFDYEGMNQNWLGEAIYLRIQAIGEELYSRPGDFVLVSLKTETFPKDGFYRIEQIDGSDSSDFGSSIRFGLRPIDENMVCYPQLLA